MVVDFFNVIIFFKLVIRVVNFEGLVYFEVKEVILNIYIQMVEEIFVKDFYNNIFIGFYGIVWL